MHSIRPITQSDIPFWLTLDQHVSETELQRKVRDKMGFILLSDNKPIGILRYNLFWDNTPFCTMLYIKESFQHHGYGQLLMAYWETEMKQLGYGMAMTSTQVDEEAQHFYRKLGYTDAGGLLINIPKYEQPMELFFIKPL